jgi:hypothetical protein
MIRNTYYTQLIFIVFIFNIHFDGSCKEVAQIPYTKGTSHLIHLFVTTVTERTVSVRLFFSSFLLYLQHVRN